MSSTITDMLYYIVNTSRVKEKNMNKVQLGVIRQAIKNNIYIMEGHKSWYYIIVIKDARNPIYIKITYRNKTEL